MFFVRPVAVAEVEVADNAAVVAVVQVEPPFDDTCKITPVAPVGAAKENAAVVDVLDVFAKELFCHWA